MTDRSRGRERRRKRKRSEDFEDEGISRWKLGLVIGVIVVCFAMLYPTVFHPMIMGFFGAKDVQKSNANKPPIHPGMGPGGPRTGGGPRHDHPAMRMAAAQHDAQQSTGGGRGMFTWMLPIYTVGVVIFLLYTLFKSKKKKKRRSYGSDSEESDSYDECGGQFSGKLGKKKLRGLQERLQQTEEAMTKILEQLEAVQGLDLTSIDQTTPTPKKDQKKKEPISVKPALSSQSEQYIGDLEKALKEFKVLSEAYEKEKDRHLAEEDESMTSDSELNSSASSADSEEEERVRQKERSRRRKEKEKKVKEVIPKEESDEREDDSQAQALGEQSEEEDLIQDGQQELVEETKVVLPDEPEDIVETPVPAMEEESRIESKPVDKKVRRRARRI
ncbi:unnamed protein product [Auanema sp. JU1783]|nr:unnamed protein product [Auanema sp. JU1783]